MRGVSALGGLVVLLAGSSLAGAAPVTRYTLPAAPPAKVAAPGTLKVSLPTGWSVQTAWPPRATDPRHAGVAWSLDALLQPAGTTLADVRGSVSWTGCRKGWGYERQLGSAYQSLPVGKVWRYTMRIYEDRGCRVARGDLRQYWLDRGVVARDGRKVFLVFEATCRTGRCPALGRQVDAIMRSLRLTP